MEDVLLPVRLIRDPRVVTEAPEDLHLVRLEARLHPEGASCPTLTGKTVTDGDGKRVARDFQTKLAAVTRGLASGHRRKPSRGRSPHLRLAWAVG